MRDDYGLIESGIPPELVAKLLGNRDRQKVAEAMMALGAKPVENMGGPGAKVSWTQGLAQMLNAYQGGKGMRDADANRQAIADEIARGQQASLARYKQTAEGTPGVTPLTPNDDEGNAMPSVAAVPGNRRKAIVDAFMDPYMKNSLLPKMDLADLNRDEEKKAQQEFLAAQAAENRKQREHELRIRGEEGRKTAAQVAEEKKALALQLAEIKAAAGGGGNPFFQAVSTPQGIMAFDARKGTMAQIAGPDGSPVMKATDSPALQGQIGAAKEAGKEGSKANQVQFDAAQSASDSLGKLDNLITHLKTSSAITGLGAETLKNIERAKALVSGSIKAGKAVSDTELLDVMMGSDVFPMIQSLGIGARGMDTTAEREFIRQVMTGTIPMNKETLIRMAETRKNIAERVVNRFNDRVSKGELDNWFRDAGRTKQTFDLKVPTATGPNGQKLYLRNGQWVPQ